MNNRWDTYCPRIIHEDHKGSELWSPLPDQGLMHMGITLWGLFPLDYKAATAVSDSNEKVSVLMVSAKT